MNQPMITDQQAQRIASDWHGGGGSALYQFASMGAITEALRHEITNTIADDLSPSDPEIDRLCDLRDYVETIGERGPVADWYARVICAN